MNKLLLILLTVFLLPNFANSQSLKLINEDGSDIPNDSIWISKSNTENVIEVPIYVKNLTSSSLEVKVKKYELELISGSEAYFCWDQCYANTTFLSPNFETAEPNDTIKSFSGDFKPFGNTGLSKVMYTFFKGKDENDSASITIYYDVVTVGIKDIENLKQSISCYPNPSSDYLNFKYNLDQNSQGEILIYDLVGKKVKLINITNSSDHSRISVSDLNPGIYIWTIEIDGIPVKSEKIIKR